MMQAWIRTICGGGVGSREGVLPQPERHPSEMPFSFLCGRRSSRDWATRNNAARESTAWRDGKRQHVLLWRDAESALGCVMELTEFSDFPAMEWVVRIRYDGTAESDAIREFKALDTCWNVAPGGDTPELRRAYGSDGRFDDFQLVRDELRQSMWDAGRRIRMDGLANAAFRKVRNGSPGFLPADQRPSATWLPLNSIRPMARPGDTYHARSAYSSGLVMNLERYSLWDFRQPGFPWNWIRQRLVEARRLRPYFCGDFYPLTPCVFDLDSWMAYQLLLPEKQEGAVLAFRRPASSMTAGCFRLYGLDAEAAYAFEDADDGRTWRTSGRELMEKGLALSMDIPRSSRLLFFRRRANSADSAL